MTSKQKQTVVNSDIVLTKNKLYNRIIYKMSSKENSPTHENSSSDSDLTAAFNATAANRLINEKRCSTAQKEQEQQQQQQEEEQQQEEQNEQQQQQQEQQEQGEEVASGARAMETDGDETPAPESSAVAPPDDETSASESPADAPPESPAAAPPPTPRLPRRKQAHPLSRVDKLQREMQLLQNSTCFMIPRLSFGRLVREFIQKHSPSTTCITRGALEALQTATEMFLTQRFQDSYLMTMHRGRVTLEVRDMALMAAICKLHGQL